MNAIERYCRADKWALDRFRLVMSRRGATVLDVLRDARYRRAEWLTGELWHKLPEVARKALQNPRERSMNASG